MEKNEENMIDMKIAGVVVVLAYLVGVHRGKVITLKSIEAIARAVRDA